MLILELFNTNHLLFDSADNSLLFKLQFEMMGKEFALESEAMQPKALTYLAGKLFPNMILSLHSFLQTGK